MMGKLLQTHEVTDTPVNVTTKPKCAFKKKILKNHLICFHKNTCKIIL